MPRKNKFEEARVKLPNGIEYNMSVDDITYLRNTNIWEYNKISQLFFCSECFKARLTHCSGSKILPYLKTINGSSHDEDCSCLLDSLGKKDMEELYRESSTDDVQNRLQHFIEFICLGNIPTYNPLIYSKVVPVADKEEKTSETKTVRNYIPRKSITNGISDKDIDVLKFFYGKVYLLTDIKKDDDIDDEKYAFLRLYTVKDNKKGHLILSIKIGKNVLSNIPEESLKSNQIVYIAFFAYVSKYRKDSRYYYNVKLRHSKHLCVVHIPQ